MIRNDFSIPSLVGLLAMSFVLSTIYAQQDAVTFSGAESADKAAARDWKALHDYKGSEFNFFGLVGAHRNAVHHAAIGRLDGPGGLGKTFAPNTIDNLKILAKIDPNRPVRPVPVDAPPGLPVYLTEHMQRCLLAYLTLKNPNRSLTLKTDKNEHVENEVDLIDIELAYQAGRSLDKEIANILHSDAVEGLSKLFNKPYTATERQRLAQDLSLSEDEIEALHKRFETAKTYLRTNP
jgi:hypothetical protein